MKPRMMKKQKEKMFIVKKYVKAVSALEALKKERRQPADDCWIDEDWKKDNLANAIGFSVDRKSKDA